MRLLRPRWKVRGETSRVADLYGTGRAPNVTTLGSLREFVAQLEAWPDGAEVETKDGMLVRVTYWETADTLVRQGES